MNIVPAARQNIVDEEKNGEASATTGMSAPEPRRDYATSTHCLPQK
jgi:hypothetical protein